MVSQIGIGETVIYIGEAPTGQAVRVTRDSGHGIHAYTDDESQEIGYCSAGDYANDSATHAEAMDALGEALDDPDNPLWTG